MLNNIVTLKYWKGHSMSLEIAPFESLSTVAYSSSIATVAVNTQ